MILRLVFALLLLLASSAWAAPAYVQVWVGGDYINVAPGTVASASAGSATTTGNMIAVGCIINSSDDASPNGVTVTDQASNTYTASAHIADTSGRGIMGFYALNITGHATNVVTCHTTLTTAYVDVIAIEVSGIATSNALDATATGTRYNAATPVTSGTFTTAQASEIAIAFVGRSHIESANDFTAGTGYTLPAGGRARYLAESEYTEAVQYQVFSSVQTNVTASMDFTGPGAGAGESMVVMTFKAPSSSPRHRAVIQ